MIGLFIHRSKQTGFFNTIALKKLSKNRIKSFPLSESSKTSQLHKPMLWNPRMSLSIAGSNKPKSKDNISSHATTSEVREMNLHCPLYKKQHYLQTCAKFKTFSAKQRRDQVKKKRACFNCWVKVMEWQHVIQIIVVALVIKSIIHFFI